jgi:NAD(P)-dependent dehydrogenase (short-subunit alcohol dehydrogenase family)
LKQALNIQKEKTMGNRLENKIAIVIGAGQTPGDTIGNGRAMSVLFAREGAKVLLVDKSLKAAEDTQKQIEQEGGESHPIRADIRNMDDCKSVADKCMELYDRIDILVYNVGTGDGRSSVEMPVERWDLVFDINLKGLFYMYRFVLPIMEKQESGALVNISSIAAIAATPMLAYRSSKAGMNALTQSIAFQYAKKGIRANAIMPGLMDTPMAIEGLSTALGIEKGELRDARDKRVPLKGGMGTAWDVAYAALFLVSDEAKFISGAILPVDGAQSVRVG